MKAAHYYVCKPSLVGVCVAEYTVGLQHDEESWKGKAKEGGRLIEGKAQQSYHKLLGFPPFQQFLPLLIEVHSFP
jgi:hypothetical protein